MKEEFNIEAKTPRTVEEIARTEMMMRKARLAERERCAKICDEVARSNRTTRKGEGAMLCADAIRKD